MTITDLFDQLGAPLRNHRWSWGSLSPNGCLFLRVWADRIPPTTDGMRHVLLMHNAGSTDSPGWGERKEHVERIRRNHSMPVLCIVCTAVDPEATPRDIRDFDRKTILRGYGDDLYEDHFGNVRLKTTLELLAPHLKRGGGPTPKPRLVSKGARPDSRTGSRDRN